MPGRGPVAMRGITARVVAKEVQPLTPDEARLFLESIKGDSLEALFAVAVSLGLRQGEALALRWQDVDWASGKLRVRYALQRIAPRKNGADHSKKPTALSEIHLVEPKTKKGRRVIDLPQVARSALAAHQMRQAEVRVLAGSRWTVPVVHCEGRLEQVEDFVVVTPIGTPLDPCSLNNRFKAILKAAGIAAHPFHDLRHTAATLRAVQRVHSKTIQSVLGWDRV